MSDTKTIEFLARELAEAREEISRLEAELAEIKGSLARSARIDETTEPQTLPVPRLEIEWAMDPGGFSVAHYRLVYEHMLGHIVRVELGRTQSSGSRLERLKYPLSDWDLPYRDGAHIKADATHLRLPAFIRHGDEWMEIDPMENRPWAAIARDMRSA